MPELDAAGQQILCRCCQQPAEVDDEDVAQIDAGDYHGGVGFVHSQHISIADLNSPVECQCDLSPALGPLAQAALLRFRLIQPQCVDPGSAEPVAPGFIGGVD